MTGPRDALAGCVIPPAGFAARTYSVARDARTAPSTTSAICARALQSLRTWQPQPRRSTSTRSLRPSQGQNAGSNPARSHHIHRVLPYDSSAL